MATTYVNPWHQKSDPTYGGPTYTTDAKPVEHRGYLIYHRIAFDVVKDGRCVGCYAGLSGAKDYIDRMLAGEEIALFHAARAGHKPLALF